MLALFMTLVRTARHAEAGDSSSNERELVPCDVLEAGESVHDAEALLLRLGLPREFAA